MHRMLGRGHGSRQGADCRKEGHASKHDSSFMRGNLLKYTAITCSASPSVIKNGRLGAPVSPVLAKETGLHLVKLEFGSRGWLGVTGDQRDSRILSSPGN